MANVVESPQKLEEGCSNLICKLVARLDTSDEAYAIKVDPTTFTDSATVLGCSSITTDGNTHPTRIRIREIDFDIEDGLTVALWWDVDGTQANAKKIVDLEGRGVFDYRDIGGLVNNATNPTGKIALSTQGWSSALILSYAINLQLIKS